MSIIGEVLADARSAVNEILGNACILTNTVTMDEAEVTVIIQSDVEYYQNGQFIGLVTTGVFNLGECSPLLDNELQDLETGIVYSLDGIKDETSTKAEFILGQVR